MESEIRMPIFNNTPNDIEDGQLVIIEKNELHVYLWGKYRKYRWYHRLLNITPAQVGIVKNIDTSGFKPGDKLYTDPNNPGGIIAISDDNIVVAWIKNHCEVMTDFYKDDSETANRFYNAALNDIIHALNKDIKPDVIKGAPGCVTKFGKVRGINYQDEINIIDKDIERRNHDR